MTETTMGVNGRRRPKSAGLRVAPAGYQVGGPVSTAWGEGTLTRAKELESLLAWLRPHGGGDQEHLAKAIAQHLEAARDAASHKKQRPWRPVSGSLMERAISNLDAAEADLLQLAPPEYVLGQMSSLLNHVQRHLDRQDPRREEVERIARKLGVADPDHPRLEKVTEPTLQDKLTVVTDERSNIVSAVRGASSAALREQLRVNSFRNVLIATTAAMTLLALGVAVMGLLNPARIPMCFQPEKSGQTVVVCPTGQSALVATSQQAAPAQPDIDDVVKQTAGPWYLFTV
jgi:hypothetical protein